MRSDRRRAVSDTLGFVLVFALVVSMVGVVYVGGFGSLTDARDAQQFSNTERAFDVLDSNVDDLAVRGAPSRTTEILLSDGAVGFGDPVTFNVTNTPYEATVEPLVYRADDGDELVYANGALFRQYDDTAVMFGEPRFVAGNRTAATNRTLVPIVDTQSRTDGVSTDGTRQLLVRTTATSRSADAFPDAATLVVESPRAAAWEQYLEAAFDEDCAGPADGRTGEVECPLSGTAYVHEVIVGVAVS